MARTITRDELKTAIDAGEVTVVETLRTEHFEQGHLPGAMHIHFEEIREKAPAMLPAKTPPSSRTARTPLAGTVRSRRTI